MIRRVKRLIFLASVLICQNGVIVSLFILFVAILRGDNAKRVVICAVDDGGQGVSADRDGRLIGKGRGIYRILIQIRKSRRITARRRRKGSVHAVKRDRNGNPTNRRTVIRLIGFRGRRKGDGIITRRGRNERGRKRIVIGHRNALRREISRLFCTDTASRCAVDKLRYAYGMDRGSACIRKVKRSISCAGRDRRRHGLRHFIGLPVFFGGENGSLHSRGKHQRRHQPRRDFLIQILFRHILFLSEIIFVL